MDCPIKVTITTKEGKVKELQIGDGVKDADCYFSGDNGETPRKHSEIAEGDTLHLVGGRRILQYD